MSSAALVLNPVYSHWNVATVDATDFYGGERVATGSNHKTSTSKHLPHKAQCGIHTGIV
jgi:hypothetical protein